MKRISIPISREEREHLANNFAYGECFMDACSTTQKVMRRVIKVIKEQERRR